MNKLLCTLTATLALAAGPVLAQTVKSIKAEPAAAKAGEPVTVTAEFDTSAGLNCGARIHFGDGATENLKINQASDATITRQHRYAKPGSYTVMLEPKTQLPVLKCLGKNQKATLTVAAAAAAPAAVPASGPKAGAAAAPGCPAGWTVDSKAANKKTGAFGCKAKAGTAAPADKLACPGSLGYYENLKKGQIGCRP
ncbi:hypothetical protein BurJ1DRAFT_0244 [Burkholderiales bacterium JOSHI_001]|nr:hypothetical protein BurJ1DRAFT_0244 [Burkholderiales bacterium JOSHI_001]